VPVVRLRKKTYAPGGAANVAANIAGLGATPVLIGTIGNDEDANLLCNVMGESGVASDTLVRSDWFPTTVKTRVIAHSQQVVRIDQEAESNSHAPGDDQILAAIRKEIDGVDIVLLSDYAKGLLTEGVISELIDSAKAKGKMTLVDPKGKEYGKYRGATLITPNQREAAEACSFEVNRPEKVDQAGEYLLAAHSFGAVLITRGEDGMSIYRQGTAPVHLKTTAKEVYDVTGAGDTVIATFAAALGAGADFESAARVANAAAGLVVEQVGTTPITLEKLRNALEIG
jgi:D-beta-D-heptose 7-phosphate kinase/D-beta-D-heptose 1-phosphate adenosyltransferase